MAKVVSVIDNNILVINQLIQIGRAPLSILTDYDIYRFFMAVVDEPKKMKRYKRVALNFKVSVETVRKAVRDMERIV